jgi:hypothetical protein
MGCISIHYDADSIFNAEVFLPFLSAHLCSLVLILLDKDASPARLCELRGILLLEKFEPSRTRLPFHPRRQAW